MVSVLRACSQGMNPCFKCIFPIRFACLGVVLLYFFSLSVYANLPTPTPIPPPKSSEHKISTHLSWKDKYTLGASDIINISFYGRPELDRTQVFIQPDGTICYLQAQNVKAEGASIDELSERLEVALSPYYKYPRIAITPSELKSKKYFILGKVVNKGAYDMTMPITLLEAIARARGFETGLFETRIMDMAYLPGSFLVRDGKKLNIDMEKLFHEGDLSQNVELEPGDFIYFPSANTREIYVLGQVFRPGVQGFTPDMTVMGAIARREGFTKAAYRERVLVIRGSIHKPQVFVIDTNAVLKGRALDFALEPKDIVYVAGRPWRFAEELLDTAVQVFIESAVTEWTGASFGPFIKNQILPKAEVR